MSELITDHAFIPSKRNDSCDYTELPIDGPWTVCDYPESAHAQPGPAAASPEQQSAAPH